MVQVLVLWGSCDKGGSEVEVLGAHWVLKIGALPYVESVGRDCKLLSAVSERM